MSDDNISPKPQGGNPPTRKGFRILAGIIAAFLLLVSLPLASSGAFTDTWWESAIWAFASLFAGIGMALGARTGRWYGSCG